MSVKTTPAYPKPSQPRGGPRSERFAAGFIVTSNVDGVTQEDAANAARSEASLDAGVHYSSSDFPAPVSSRDYWFDISEGEPAQCNPVFGSDPCTPKDIENLP